MLGQLRIEWSEVHGGEAKSRRERERENPHEIFIAACDPCYEVAITSTYLSTALDDIARQQQ